MPQNGQCIESGAVDYLMIYISNYAIPKYQKSIPELAVMLERTLAILPTLRCSDVHEF